MLSSGQMDAALRLLGYEALSINNYWRLGEAFCLHHQGLISHQLKLNSEYTRSHFLEART